MIEIDDKNALRLLEDLQKIRVFLDGYFEPDISKWVGFFQAKTGHLSSKADDQ